MAAIQCASCRRPFNDAFPACPFCSAQVRAAPAPAPRAAPVKCARCARPYNPGLPACPFCKAPTAGPAEDGALERQMAELAARVIALNGPLSAPLSFTPAGVHALDANFDLTYGEAGRTEQDPAWEPDERSLGLIIAYGAFFGETLRRLLGGCWQANARHPSEATLLQLVLPGGASCAPVARALERATSGRAYDFSSLFMALARRPGAAEVPQTAADWEAVIGHFERVGRADLAAAALDAAERGAPQLAAGLGPARGRLAQATAALESTRRKALPPWEQPGATFDFARWGREELDGLAARAGVRLDLSLASLAGLDGMLNGQWGREPRPEEEKESEAYRRHELMLGCYLGEFFVRRCGAAWDRAAERADGTHVVWPTGNACCPFVYFSKRHTNGWRHGIHAQVSMWLGILQQTGAMRPLDPGVEARSWLQQAEAFAERKALDAARQFAEQSLRVEPSARAHLKLAEWYRGHAGKAAESDRHLEQALALDPSDVEARIVAAHHAHASGRAADARAHLDLALPAARGHPGALLLDARLKADAGQLPLAAEAYGAVLSLRELPVSARREAALGQARAFVQLGQPAKAREVVEQARGAVRDPELGLLLGDLRRATGALALAADVWAELERASDTPAGLRAAAQARLAAVEKEVALWEQRAANARDAEEAIAAWRRVLALSPTHGEAMRETSVALAVSGRLEEALAMARRALAAHPDDVRSFDNLAVILGQLERFEAALPVIDQGLARHPDSATLHMRRGNFTARLDRFQEAWPFLARSAELDPLGADAWICKADVERELGRADAALETIRTLLRHWAELPPRKLRLARELAWALENPARQRRPDDAQRWKQRAFEAVQRGDGAQALTCFTEATETDPLDEEAWFNRGSGEAQFGRMDEAIRSWSRALELMPGFTPALKARAQALGRIGRIEQALVDLDAVLRTASRSERQEVLGERARLLWSAGRREEALATTAELLALSPGDVATLKRRSNLLRELRRPAEALQEIDEAIAAAPGDQRLKLEKALVLRDLGRDEESDALMFGAFDDQAFADEWHEEGLRLLGVMTGGPAPKAGPSSATAEPRTDGTALKEKALAFVAAGELRQALLAYEQACAAAPDDSTAWKDRGNCLVELGRPAEAIPCFDRASALLPTACETWYCRARALLKLERTAELVDAYQRFLALDHPPHEEWAKEARAFLAAHGAREKGLDELGLFDAFIKPYFERASAVGARPAEIWAALGQTFSPVRPDVGTLCDLKALELDHHQVAPLARLGSELVRRGRHAQALDTFQRVLALDAGHAPSWFMKGALELQLGRAPAAKASLTRYLALAEREPAARVQQAKALLAGLGQG